MNPIETKYYIYGVRPIIEEVFDSYRIFYAYQWDTGEFKEDIEYYLKVRNDPSGDCEEVTKEEFDEYVEKKRREKGFI